MLNLDKLVQKAKTSKFYLYILNFVLLKTVPFNKPHKLKLTQITDDEIVIKADKIKENCNHIQGIHACLLATLCEYATGLSLLLQLPPTKYRIILKSIKMDYHLQAKTAVFATFKISANEIETEILTPLQTVDAIFKEYTIKIFDENQKHVCTGYINWQIKAWDKVKTKLN